jgi:hypothetical protein
MKRFVSEAQLAAGSALDECLHFSHDGKGNLIGRVRADVQADRGVQLREIGRAQLQAFLAKVIYQPFRARARSQEADVAYVRGKQDPKKREVVQVVMGHHYRRGANFQLKILGNLMRRHGDHRVGGRESIRNGETATTVHDRHGPAKPCREVNKWNRVVSSAEYEKRLRGQDRLDQMVIANPKSGVA